MPYSDISLPSSLSSGGGEYIYVEESQSSLLSQPAQLLSPLIRGPICLRFYYYMNGSGIGNLEVLLWPRGQQDNYLMWRKSGEQGNQWLKATVDVGFTGESQVGAVSRYVLKLFLRSRQIEGNLGICKKEEEEEEELWSY